MCLSCGICESTRQVNHVDRSETHVVSCIFHIGNDLDEPWPLEIEDHDGKVHAVVMEPGTIGDETPRVRAFELF